MKFKVLFLIAITFFSLTFFASSLSAQESSNRPQRPTTITDKRIKLMEEKEVRIAERSAIQKERIMSFSGRMIVRLDAMVSRLQKIIDRIEARIAKIDSQENPEIDTAEAKALLESAKASLALANVEIVAFKATLAELPESENPKEDFMVAKEIIATIKENLKEVHLNLTKVIQEIKGLRVGESQS